MSSFISGMGAVGFAGALLKKSDGAGFFSSAACLAVLPLLNIEAVVLLKNPPDVGAGFPVKKFFREPTLPRREPAYYPGFRSRSASDC